MEIWRFQLAAVTLFALVSIHQGLSFSVDKERWVTKDWQDEQVRERLASQVASLIKKSISHQFYGLMGKRSDLTQPVGVARRRNKGEMFVGLMGRRALSGESFTKIIPDATLTVLDVSEESHKQQDSEEEWDKLQYY